jgi:hypothetical protein
MRVVSVEVLSGDQAASLCSQGRRQRREDRIRSGKMTIVEAADLFWAGLSEYKVRAPLLGGEPIESPLPLVANEQVGPYEDPEGIALLNFARANEGKVLLVQLSCEPSKAFVRRLRYSAKIRRLEIHFTRLNREWVTLEVSPKESNTESDDDFLKGLGVRW